MEKEEALNEFLKGLRIVINNASAYPKEHPYFVKSVDVFKQKAETLLNYLNPINIKIGPDSLFIDGKTLAKTLLYVDLSSMFHIRKIKSIELKPGLLLEELTDFLSSVSLPIREILRKGGIRNILQPEKSPHIFIEELDYSELLRDEGEETKDIWVYLFKGAVQNQDLAKINSFAENFESIIGKFRAKDLCEDEELRQNLHNFLVYLKGTAKDKFVTCSKDLLRLFLRDPDISQEEKLEKAKVFFQDLTNQDLTDALMESISKDDDFNHLSFAVFSRLFERARHHEIASGLEKRLREAESLKTSSQMRKKVKEIFSVTDDSYILPLYRQALGWLSEDKAAGAKLTFDHDLLQANYRFLLLNLLTQEDNPDTIELIAERLSKECDQMMKEGNREYLKSLLEVLNGKCKQETSTCAVLRKLQERIATFVENTIFEETDPQAMEYFVHVLDKSSLGLDFYIDKIFKERKINPYALRLLLKFFPDRLSIFYENLERVKSDIDFLVKIIKSFKGTDSPLGAQVLKRIFFISNNIIKAEALKAMQSLPAYDSAFLLTLLRKEGFLLKKEAFFILARDDDHRKAALDVLFSVSSPFGMRNALVLENMRVIDGLRGAELTGAREYLERLSKKRFFWNKEIREEAQNVLERNHVR